MGSFHGESGSGHGRALVQVSWDGLAHDRRHVLNEFIQDCEWLVQQFHDAVLLIKFGVLTPSWKWLVFQFSQLRRQAWRCNTTLWTLSLLSSTERTPGSGEAALHQACDGLWCI